MESQMFDIVNSHKEKAIANFNCFRRIAKLWQILEVLVVLGLISWSSARAPAVFTAAFGYAVAISAALFNHHVVFLIGNSIIVLLFLLCRQNDAVCVSDGDLYSDYVKHSDAAAAADQDSDNVYYSPAAEDGGEGAVEKRIVAAAAIPQCDDVAAAIEKAKKQIKRFERTQSEKLKREIKTTSQPRLRRSETSRRDSVSSGELEMLSNEEFRRTIDAFINQHGFQKKMQQKQKQNQFDEYEKYQLLKIA